MQIWEWFNRDINAVLQEQKFWNVKRGLGNSMITTGMTKDQWSAAASSPIFNI